MNGFTLQKKGGQENICSETAEKYGTMDSRMDLVINLTYLLSTELSET